MCLSICNRQAKIRGVRGGKGEMAYRVVCALGHRYFLLAVPNYLSGQSPDLGQEASRSGSGARHRPCLFPLHRFGDLDGSSILLSTVACNTLGIARHVGIHDRGCIRTTDQSVRIGAGRRGRCLRCGICFAGRGRDSLRHQAERFVYRRNIRVLDLHLTRCFGRLLDFGRLLESGRLRHIDRFGRVSYSRRELGVARIVLLRWHRLLSLAMVLRRHRR